MVALRPDGAGGALMARTEGDVLVDDVPLVPSRPRSGGALRRWLSPELLSIIVLLGLWEIVPRLMDSRWLPSFSEVVTALGEIQERGLLVENVLASLRSLSIGYAISVVVGLVVGALMGRYKVVEAALDVFVEAALFTPSLILAPIFFAIFGLGDETRIAVVVAYGLPIVILNTSAGVRTVDPGLIEMARSFGSSELTLARRVLLPASSPLTLEGLRLGLGRSIKGMINGEVFIALTGLGGLASTYGSQLDSAKVLAISLVVLIIAVITNWVFTRFERRATRWLN